VTEGSMRSAAVAAALLGGASEKSENAKRCVRWGRWSCSRSEQGKKTWEYHVCVCVCVCVCAHACVCMCEVGQVVMHQMGAGQEDLDG